MLTPAVPPMAYFDASSLITPEPTQRYRHEHPPPPPPPPPPRRPCLRPLRLPQSVLEDGGDVVDLLDGEVVVEGVALMFIPHKHLRLPHIPSSWPFVHT